MWECYRLSDRLYEFLGLGDRFVIHVHKEGHAVLEEDLALMLPYFEKVICGKDADVDLAALKTSVFAGQEK